MTLTVNHACECPCHPPSDASHSVPSYLQCCCTSTWFPSNTVLKAYHSTKPIELDWFIICIPNERKWWQKLTQVKALCYLKGTENLGVLGRGRQQARFCEGVEILWTGFGVATSEDKERLRRQSGWLTVRARGVSKGGYRGGGDPFSVYGKGVSLGMLAERNL